MDKSQKTGITAEIPRKYAKRGSWPSLVRTQTESTDCRVQVSWCTVSNDRELSSLSCLMFSFKVVGRLFWNCHRENRDNVYDHVRPVPMINPYKPNLNAC